MAEPQARERLQKALARAGLGSRREVEVWIRAGRLTVNGVVAGLGTKVDDRDEVRLDGRPIRRRAVAADQVFIVHRSTGEPLRATRGGVDGQALVDRLPRNAGRRYIAVSPMPEVDGGLELVTSDGALAARLQRTVRDLPCVFSVRIHGELAAAALGRVLAGELDSGERVRVVRCEAGGGEASNRWYELEATGASGREVRQLFERQGALVSRVLRTRLGSVQLGRELARGHFRRLTAEEVAALIPESPGSASAAPAAQGEVSRPGSRTSRPSRRGRPGRAA